MSVGGLRIILGRACRKAGENKLRSEGSGQSSNNHPDRDVVFSTCVCVAVPLRAWVSRFGRKLLRNWLRVAEPAISPI